jgi:hypothetical protein
VAFISLPKLSFVSVKEIVLSGILIDFVGATTTDLSAKKYLIFCFVFSSAMVTLEPPLKFKTGLSNSSTDLKNSDKS